MDGPAKDPVAVVFVLLGVQHVHMPELVDLFGRGEDLSRVVDHQLEEASVERLDCIDLLYRPALLLLQEPSDLSKVHLAEGLALALFRPRSVEYTGHAHLARIYTEGKHELLHQFLSDTTSNSRTCEPLTASAYSR